MSEVLPAAVPSSPPSLPRANLAGESQDAASGTALSLSSYVEQLAGVLQGVKDRVQVIETKQVEQEGELQACLEGLSSGWAKGTEQRCDKQDHQLRRLSADVSALKTTLELRGGVPLWALSSPSTAAKDVSGLDARMAALEKGQKAVAVGARRALHTALVVHQQQQSQEDGLQWERCLESLPVTELRESCNVRFSEQDRRMDQILHMVEALTDRILLTGSTCEGEGSGSFEGDQKNCPDASLCHGHLREFVTNAIDSFEAKMIHSFNTLSQRLDALHDDREGHRLALRQLNNQLPEISQRLDLLWSQSRQYFARIQEHDVKWSISERARSKVEPGPCHLAHSSNHSEMDERADDSWSLADSALTFAQPVSRYASGLNADLAASSSAPASSSAAPRSDREDSIAVAVPRYGGCASDPLDSRTRMLAQVMERLHANSGDLSSGC